MKLTSSREIISLISHNPDGQFPWGSSTLTARAAWTWRHAVLILHSLAPAEIDWIKSIYFKANQDVQSSARLLLEFIVLPLYQCGGYSSKVLRFFYFKIFKTAWYLPKGIISYCDMPLSEKKLTEVIEWGYL